MKTPNYMTGRKPVKIPLHRVMDVLDHIDELGHSDQFKAALEKAGAFVTIHPKTVNLVKKYMATQDLHMRGKLAASVVGSCPPGQDQNSCPFET